MTEALPLVVLAPNFPPTICGVGDYTAHLLAAWPRRLRCLLRPTFPGDGVAAEATLSLRDEPVRVRTVNPHAKPLRHALAGLGPCHLLVQYSAYGYDPRWGCPVGLCHALAGWAEEAHRTSGGRLVVMFHELWADEWPLWHPHHWVQALHRRALGQLARAASHVFTTTAHSAARVRKMLDADCDNVTTLPTGANILAQETAAAAATREPGLFILFGLQGTRLRCLRALRENLAALARAGRLQRLVLLGRDQSAAMTAEEISLLNETVPPTSDARWERLGERPADEISNWMSRAEFGLAFQSEVNFTKSSTLMAYFAHGLNVISPYAGPGKPEPLHWQTAPDEILFDGGVVAAQRYAERSAALRHWWQQHASWSNLAAEYERVFS